MLVIRPITQEDYPALYEIAVESGVGFTSLPVNEEILHNKIDCSQESFAKAINEPGEESYLFVLEDTDSGEIVGTTAISSGVGLSAPFYHYHRSVVVHASQELSIHNKMEVLILCNHYTGSTEVCTLYLKEPYRQGTNGRLLSKSRFLFLADFPERFSSRVIAEMRGYSDEKGNSPFWSWLGEHFFKMDFARADYMVGMGNKVFIAELMPKYPLYVNLLSPEAKAAISQVHPKTAPALRLLEKEGFKHVGYIDIFDGGPTVEAELSQINSIRNSRLKVVKVGKVDEKLGEPHLISNRQLKDYRCGIDTIQVIEHDRVIISPKLAETLQLQDGDSARIVAVDGYYRERYRL
ncbi:arginine N-succinyltransferase [Balneatrix alpica]|uniref:Arginine N-succinyltransferase n=1 Tax=Balneatrix alpica TaxID=75684 RepID=A0ABV5Z9I3_9GAMM|nr:arginine N-succinyltransferase [Balneatrix alpica]